MFVQGATLPFGMAKAVADVNTEIQGGFASDDGESKEILAFEEWQSTDK